MQSKRSSYPCHSTALGSRIIRGTGRSGRRSRCFVFRFSAVAVYNTAYLNMFVASAFYAGSRIRIGFIFPKGSEEFNGGIGSEIFVDLVRSRAKGFDRPDLSRIISVFAFGSAFFASAQQEMQEAVLAAVGRIAGSRIIRIIFRGFTLLLKFKFFIKTLFRSRRTCHLIHCPLRCG